MKHLNIQWQTDMLWYVIKSGNCIDIVWHSNIICVEFKIICYIRVFIQKEREKHLGSSPRTILHPLTEVKCMDRNGRIRRLSKEDRLLDEILRNGIHCIIANILNILNARC